MNLRSKRGRRRFRGKAFVFYNRIRSTLYEEDYIHYLRFIMNRHYYFISHETISNLDLDYKVSIYKAFLFGKFLRAKERDDIYVNVDTRGDAVLVTDTSRPIIKQTISGRISLKCPPLSNTPKAGYAR